MGSRHRRKHQPTLQQNQVTKPLNKVPHKFAVDERVLCYEPDRNKARVLYDSKVIQAVERTDEKGKIKVEYKIHFFGWNSSWDRYVDEDCVLKDTDENRDLQRDLKAKADVLIQSHTRNKKKRKKTLSELVKEVSKDKAGKGSHDKHDGDPAAKSSSGSDVSDHESSDDDTGRPLPQIVVPAKLKTVLERDFYFVTKRQMFVKLPAHASVVCVFEGYVKFLGFRQLRKVLDRKKTAAEELGQKGPGGASGAKTKGATKKTFYNSNKAQPKPVCDNWGEEIVKLYKQVQQAQEVVYGLKTIFDHLIGQLLLYSEEDEQFKKFQGAKPKVPVINCSRLIPKLPIPPGRAANLVPVALPLVMPEPKDVKRKSEGVQPSTSQQGLPSLSNEPVPGTSKQFYGPTVKKRVKGHHRKHKSSKVKIRKSNTNTGQTQIKSQDRITDAVKNAPPKSQVLASQEDVNLKVESKDGISGSNQTGGPHVIANENPETSLKGTLDANQSTPAADLALSSPTKKARKKTENDDGTLVKMPVETPNDPSASILAAEEVRIEVVQNIDSTNSAKSIPAGVPEKTTTPKNVSENVKMDDLKREEKPKMDDDATFKVPAPKPRIERKRRAPVSPVGKTVRASLRWKSDKIQEIFQSASAVKKHQEMITEQSQTAPAPVPGRPRKQRGKQDPAKMAAAGIPSTGRVTRQRSEANKQIVPIRSQNPAAPLQLSNFWYNKINQYMKELQTWRMLPVESYQAEPEPSMVYGLVHLLRFFIKLPEILNGMLLPRRKVDIVARHVNQMLEHMEVNYQFKPEKLYTPPPKGAFTKAEMKAASARKKAAAARKKSTVINKVDSKLSRAIVPYRKVKATITAAKKSKPPHTVAKKPPAKVKAKTGNRPNGRKRKRKSKGSAAAIASASEVSKLKPALPEPPQKVPEKIVVKQEPITPPLRSPKDLDPIVQSKKSVVKVRPPSPPTQPMVRQVRKSAADAAFRNAHIFASQQILNPRSFFPSSRKQEQSEKSRSRKRNPSRDESDMEKKRKMIKSEPTEPDVAPKSEANQSKDSKGSSQKQSSLIKSAQKPSSSSSGETLEKKHDASFLEEKDNESPGRKRSLSGNDRKSRSSVKDLGRRNTSPRMENSAKKAPSSSLRRSSFQKEASPQKSPSKSVSPTTSIRLRSRSDDRQLRSKGGLITAMSLPMRATSPRSSAGSIRSRDEKSPKRRQSSGSKASEATTESPTFVKKDRDPSPTRNLRRSRK